MGMGLNNMPIYPLLHASRATVISAANTANDGSGTITSIFEGNDQSLVRVTRITVKALADTTAGMVRLFLSSDAGATWTPWREVLVAAITPGAATKTFSEEIDLTDPGKGFYLMGSSYALGASTHNAESFAITVEGGLF